MNKKNTFSVIFLLLGVVAVSTASLFIRFAQVEAPSLVIAAGRMSLAFIMIMPYAFLKFRSKIFTLTKKELFLLIMAGLFLAFHFAAWITSLEYTSIASSVVLVTTTPLWVALLSPWILKEKVNPLIWLGLLFALFGLFLIAGNYFCSFSINGNFACNKVDIYFNKGVLFGNFLALFGAWMAAGYLMVGRIVRRNIPIIKYIFYVYLFAAILLLANVGLKNLSFKGFSNSTCLWIFLLALIPQLLGHSVFNWALGRLQAAFVSVALLGEPVGTILLAYIFLREFPTLLEIIGALLILAGIFLVTFISQRTESKNPREAVVTD